MYLIPEAWFQFCTQAFSVLHFSFRVHIYSKQHLELGSPSPNLPKNINTVSCLAIYPPRALVFDYPCQEPSTKVRP